MDFAEREMLEQTLRKTMTESRGTELDAALAELGWAEMLAGEPETAIESVFRLLGETGAHASVLNDVILCQAGRSDDGATPPLPYAGGQWVVWTRGPDSPGLSLDPGLPLRQVAPGSPVPLSDGRRALGWWLLGSGRAMLALARRHVLDRHQFGRPLASFQALRHRLAETYVALEGAEAALRAASFDDTGALLAKAAAGRAALAAARHCQQALGGIGFTAEHDLHLHVKRALVLDGLLGSARELTREAGTLLIREGRAPRLVDL
ncbi:acyl-CoA dehydrogenase family protein [Streptomyces sp. NPDC050149]|uniref:acyl-CoA dehydrogenase family protein n=1 Tax=unclassified Streptomyces TaxID=2593676 RepID=UPI002E37C19C|nr:acyl-CoA dehydrogenase family protein [Streptomyces sp. NBC_01358]